MAVPLRGNDPTGVPEPEQSGSTERPDQARSSADVPTFDTYPAEPPLAGDWSRQLPERSTPDNPRLNETAEKVGSAVGFAVRRGKEALRRFDSMKQDLRRSSEIKVQELKLRAEQQWSNARETAQHRIEDWRGSARESLEEAKGAVVQRTREARVRAKAYVNENPHHVILGIAGAAFALGLTARIMRRSRRG